MTTYDIIKKCNQKCRNLYVGYKNLGRVDINDFAFGDDVIIMVGSEQDLQENE